MRKIGVILGLAGFLSLAGLTSAYAGPKLKGTYGTTMKMQCQNANPGEINPDTLEFLGETSPYDLACRVLTHFYSDGTYVMDSTQCLGINSGKTIPGDEVWSSIGTTFACFGNYSVEEQSSLEFDMSCQNQIPNGPTISISTLNAKGFVGVAGAMATFSVDVPQRNVISIGPNVLRERLCSITGTMIRLQRKAKK